MTIACGVAAGSEGDTPRPKPSLNILLITIDTLRTDRVSVYDPSHVRTPHIDGLASAGTIFLRAFSHTPLTLPAHTNILLGETPLSHGVHDNGRFVVPDESVTLAEILKDEGYATGAFVGGYPLHRRFGLGQGFDIYDDRFPSATPGDQEFAEIRAGIVVDRALAWVKGRRPPWFLWVHLFDPHHPYEPPEPFRKRYETAPYDGEVAYTDEAVGRLLTALGEPAPDGQTLVILTGDHGESLGEHGEITHGFLAYNPTLWVPLIIRLPGEKASRVAGPVSHIDIFPTVCDVLSIRTPRSLEGRTLVPAIKGRKPSSESIYFESLSPYYSRGWAPIRGLIDGTMKFIDSPIPELYDLDRDFDEKANLAGGRDLDGFRKALDGLVESRTPKDGRRAEKPLDAASVERLRSLGYLAGPSAAKKRTYGPPDDVKVLLPFHNKSMEALDLSRRGDVAGGIRRLREVITERPDMDVAYVNLALLYDSLGRGGDAVLVLENGLEVAPESHDILSHLVRFLVSAGRYREALAAAESHPLPQMESDPKIWVDLGICHRNLGDYDKALAAYEAALGIDPTYAVAYNNLGTLELSMHFRNPEGGFLEKALANFEKAVDLDPIYAAAWYGLGQSRYQGKEYEAAIEALQKCLEFQPGFGDALFYLGMSRYNEGSYAEALPSLLAYREQAKDSLSPADLKKLDERIEACRAKK